jgi:hypothetical protein
MKGSIINLGILFSISLLFSCKQTTITKEQLVGKWKTVAVEHPAIETEYELSKKEIDTMTEPDLGLIAMYQTNDLAKIKAKELDLIEKRYESTKEQLTRIVYEFNTDSLFLRRYNNNPEADTNIYQLVDNKYIVFHSKNYNSNRTDTIRIGQLKEDKLELLEPYFDKQIKLHLEKHK